MTSRTERLLMEDVEEHGWISMRAPASGARSAHEAGDVWVVRQFPAPGEMSLATWQRLREDIGDVPPLSEVYIIEEKYKSNDKNKYLQESKEKVDGLIETAEKMGAIPLFAGRWSNRTKWCPGATHFLMDIRDIERTDAGNLSVSPELAKSFFQTTKEFFG